MWHYTQTEELFHYGVLGMKWGVRRAISKQNKNAELLKKSIDYDKKAAALTKKSEKAHAKNDLENANRKAVKSAKYKLKAATLEKKALKADNDSDRAAYERKAAKLKFKSAKAAMAGDRISKTTGYGTKAMKYSIKSDKAALKAAKARKHIAENEAYIALMKKKVSSLPKDELNTKYAFASTLKDKRK